MLKKSLTFLLAALAFTAFACDDDESDPDAPKVCDYYTYAAHCDGDYAVSCAENFRVVYDPCTACRIENNAFQCSNTSNPSKPSTPSNPSKPSNPSNPGNNYVEGADCGDVTVAGLCTSSSEGVYCDNGKLKLFACNSNEVCDYGTFTDGGEGYACFSK